MSVVGTIYEPTYHGSDLLDAVRMKNLPLVHLLITQGANVNRFDREGYTALHWGSLSGSLDIVMFLVLNGAKVNIHSSDGEGVTPLMSATGKGFLDIIRFLVEQGADIMATDARGCTALAHAVQYDEIFAAHLLIKMGCSPLECDTGGHSLLHWSSYYGFYHLTDYLLSNYTINVDQADNDGRTPMYWAASRGLRAICKLLVDHGGNVLFRDHEGKTPINVAEHEKYNELANLMKTGQLSAIPRERAVYSWKDDFRGVEKQRDSVKTFLMPIFTFIAIHFVHPLVGLCVFLVAVWQFNRLSMSYHYRTQKSPLATAWWLGSCFACLYVYWHYCWSMVIVRVWYVDILFDVTLVLLFYTYGMAVLKDPGRIHYRREGLQEQLRRVEIGENVDHTRFCVTCKVWRPLRSKHCRFSNACVARYDHFCIWTNNAVGFLNHKYFLLYVYFHTITNIFLQVFYLFFMYHTWPSGNDGVIDKFLSLEPTVTFGWMYNLVVMWFSSTLAISHTFAMRRNITGNEQVNAHRYPHFHREDGRFTNPFDRGTWKNILEFFHHKKYLVDYREVYSLADVHGSGHRTVDEQEAQV